MDPSLFLLSLKHIFSENKMYCRKYLSMRFYIKLQMVFHIFVFEL